MSNFGDEDGYLIVEGYLNADEIEDEEEKASEVEKRKNSFNNIVSHNQSNPYCGGLLKKYHEEMPIWAFIELISFGDLTDLLEYYNKKTGWVIPADLKSIDRVRQIRNACAHGNCIINDLKPVKKQSDKKCGISYSPPHITQFVTDAGIKEGNRTKRLSNPRINQIVHLLYVYDKVVISENTRNIRMSELDHLLNERIKEHEAYFKSNQVLCATYEFFEKLIRYLVQKT